MSSGDTPAANTPKASLLLVDDEPQIVRALQRELDSKGFEITAFTDAELARDALAERAFDVVVSDNMMPRLTGLDLMKYVQAEHPRTRRVLLTGRTELTQAIAALNEGVIHRYVQKPWDREELLEIIANEIGIHAQARSRESRLQEMEKLFAQRTGELLRTKLQLKQAETQVTLYEDTADSTELASSSRLRKLSCLIVEGNEGVRNALVSALRKVGISRCAGTADGETAIQAVERGEQVDVVLSELQLSGMNGLKLFEALQQQAAPKPAPVFILMTTRNYIEVVHYAVDAGVNGYIFKPFHLSVLLEQIDSMLPENRSQQLEEKVRELWPLKFVVGNRNEPARLQIKHLLVSNGVEQVAVAASGQGALHMAHDRGADLLIYDCNLTNPNWTEVVATHASTEPHTRPRLVITSIAPTQKELLEVGQLGFPHFLRGPFTRNDLFAAIVKALSGTARG